MSAQRKLIREATAAILKGRTPVGDNVFASRSAPLWGEYELPAIIIYTEREQIQVQNTAPREFIRELELRIEIQAEGVDADDVLDDIGDAVERTIGRSDRLTYAKEATVADIILISEQMVIRQEGEKLVGGLIISYTATYVTPEPDEYASDPVDALKSVYTEYNLDGEQAAADRAADLVEGLDAL